MLKVAIPFHHQSELFCQEARDLLTDNGFVLECNELDRPLNREELMAMVSDAFAVVGGIESYDRDILSACRDCRTIIRFGVGTDNFDLAAMKNMGMQVGIIANHNAVAEFALTLMLSAMKSLPRYDSTIRHGEWNRYSMRELSGKTVGLVGFGRIGRRLAELLAGFEPRILAYDPYMNEAAAKERNVEPVSFEYLLSQSDVISLHLPAMESTYHLINDKTISQMKDGAYLINTSRGSLVNEKDLRRALETGKLSGVGLDVFEREPFSASDPLGTMPNTVLAPHVSALTYETNYNGSLICAESILRVFRGGKPLYPLW